jgi:hypothetical protein
MDSGEAMGGAMAERSARAIFFDVNSWWPSPHMKKACRSSSCLGNFMHVLMHKSSAFGVWQTRLRGGDININTYSYLCNQQSEEKQGIPSMKVRVIDF